MDVTFHALYISQHYYTISTLQHVLGGYIVHKSCGSFNNIVWTYHTFKFENGARGPKVRACLPPAIGELASNLTAYYFPPFPYSLSATVLLFIHHDTIFPHAGSTISSPEGNYHFSQLATEGHFHYSQLATLTISNMAPDGWESRDRGSGGGNFILEKTITSPGIHLTTY